MDIKGTSWGQKTLFLTFLGVANFTIAGLLLSTSWHITLVVMIVILSFAYSLLKTSLWVITLCILSMYDFLGLINTEVYRIPGLFKLRDVLFILVMLTWLLTTLSWCKQRYLRNLPWFSLILLLLIILTILKILESHIRYSESLALSFRDGKKYFYFFLFFPIVAYLSKTNLRPLQFTYRILLLFACAGSLILLIQSIFPYITLVPYAVKAFQSLQGTKIVRTYLPGMDLIAMMFPVMLGCTLFELDLKRKMFKMGSVILLGLGLIFTFGRGYWIQALVGIIFLLSVSRKNLLFQRIESKDRLEPLGGKSLLLVVIGFGALFIGLDIIQFDALNFIWKRFSSSFSETINVSGSFAYRIDESAHRFSLIKKMPFFGAGFIHPLSQFGRSLSSFSVSTVDSGIITTLVEFGMIGSIVLYSMFVTFVVRSVKFARKMRPSQESGIIFGIAGYIVGSIIVSITMSPFTVYHGIITAVLAFSLTEAIVMNAEKKGLL